MANPPISSPYNFVPLSSKVVKPIWGKERGVHHHKLSHDAPLLDGVSGSLDITLTNHTPLLIASEPDAKGEKTPLMQGERYVIPGSSLRGMLRNVVEIASYGRFGPGMEDRKLFARDLTKENLWYRKRMSSANVKAGWLKLMKSKQTGELRYALEPTAMERIPLNEAAELMGADPAGTEVSYDGPDGKEYVVVRTGHVHGKKSEFGFLSQPGSKPLAVSDKVFGDFVEAQKYNSGWWKQDGSFEHPGHFQAKLRSRNRIPVFYTLDQDNRVDAMGLAFMFRVAFKHSLADALMNTSSDHADGASDFDFAQALFGALPGESDDGLRSRVSFGALFSNNAVVQKEAVRVVLSSPKPSFSPAYLKQNGAQLKNLEEGKPELAGWKRYQVRSKPDVYQTGDGENDAVASRLKPLNPGATFKGTLRFHNLRQEELGALIWALTWGGNPRLRHSLGMGKPFGLGSVSVAIEGLQILHNSDSSLDVKVAGSPEKLSPVTSKYQAAFEAFMRTSVSGWPETPEIRELFAMASPENGDEAAIAGLLRYPSLKPKSRINEFRDAKNGNRRLPKPSAYPKASVPPDRR